MTFKTRKVFFLFQRCKDMVFLLNKKEFVKKLLWFILLCRYFLSISLLLLKKSSIVFTKKLASFLKKAGELLRVCLNCLFSIFKTYIRLSPDGWIFLLCWFSEFLKGVMNLDTFICGLKNLFCFLFTKLLQFLFYKCKVVDCSYFIFCTIVLFSPFPNSEGIEF